MRKILGFLLGIIFFAAGSYVLSSNKEGNSFFEKDCPFCNASIVDRQKFYEDDLVIALSTHKPIMPGHCLIIPKRHVERFEKLSEEEAARICQVIRKVDEAASQVFATSSYLLLQKNGIESGQTVPHLHFHYIPKKLGDHSTLKFMFRMFLANARKPLRYDRMQPMIESMKAEIK